MPMVEVGKPEYIWVDPPGMETKYNEIKAVVQQIESTKKISDDHELYLSIFKPSLRESTNISSKTIPLVIAMSEEKANELFTDFYSFDDNGLCLSHGYSRVKDGKLVVDGAHDTDISRLIEHGENIKEMIGDYPIPLPLLTRTTVMDLRVNCLKQKQKNYNNQT